MIEIVDYNELWPSQYLEIESALKGELGGLALRIDHIGSTAVPGLAAKPRIDVQVTVAELSDSLIGLIEPLGFQFYKGFRDRRLGMHPEPPESQHWDKLVFGSSEYPIACNIHIRVKGRANQRFALLFRDYLRANRVAASAYGTIKRHAARYFPNNKQAYYEFKDPFFDILGEASAQWALDTSWEPVS